jgi:hypothetical protein
VSYRFSNLAHQADPVISPFKLSNCDAYKGRVITLMAPYALYPRQQKVVTKMLAIEDSLTEFEELEMSEQEMPGSGFSLNARAVRKRRICGGVIADASEY